MSIVSYWFYFSVDKAKSSEKMDCFVEYRKSGKKPEHRVFLQIISTFSIIYTIHFSPIHSLTLLIFFCSSHRPDSHDFHKSHAVKTRESPVHLVLNAVLSRSGNVVMLNAA